MHSYQTKLPSPQPSALSVRGLKANESRNHRTKPKFSSKVNFGLHPTESISSFAYPRWPARFS
ncbi:MAG: hypothetical protein ACTS80_02020 [Candidatus Hodgkinia cicadicola]